MAATKVGRGHTHVVREEQRKIRAQAFSERMEVENHYRRFKAAADECEKQARGRTDLSNQKFAKWLKVAELHWKVCDKYLAILPPPTYAPEEGPDVPNDESAARPVSRVDAVVARLLGSGFHRDHAGTVPERLVVPTPLRPETQRHGESGGEAGLVDPEVPGGPGQP